MSNMKIVRVVIPAHNESASIGKVVQAIPEALVAEIVVVNNASTDTTKDVAESWGATVLDQPLKGYGHSCLMGIAHCLQKGTDIIVFLDGDFSDYPEEMPLVLKPILEQNADLVIGSRALGERESGSMTFPQVFGNWLATRLIRLFFGVQFTDLGPFRAITTKALEKLNMQDKTYGWTVEMQVKAAKLGLRCVEVPVNYRRRIGKSKVSGTIKGAFMAGVKILWTIFKYAK
jgi:glycosyltransferase involved in cell wall biosynthesis